MFDTQAKQVYITLYEHFSYKATVNFVQHAEKLWSKSRTAVHSRKNETYLLRSQEQSSYITKICRSVSKISHIQDSPLLSLLSLEYTNKCFSLNLEIYGRGDNLSKYT